jgi:ketosteroid isomerase-like protein
MNKLFTLLALALIGAGCNQAHMSTDPSVITARSAAWQEAMNSGDIDTLVAIYTDDARLMPPNVPASTGSDAIREAFSGMAADGIRVYLTDVAAEVAGDLGYHVGTYVVKSATDDVLDNGKFMEVWKHGAGGHWQITDDIWNSDMPAPMAGGAGTHVMITHQVEDGDNWLAAWRGADGRRKLFAANGATEVHTFRSADNPNLMGLEFVATDWDAFQAMLQSPEGQAAATEDGVKMDTITIFQEAE